MSALSRLRSLWRNLARRERVERELDEELHAVFDLLIAEKMARGMTPDEARRAATIELGRPDSIKTAVRQIRAGAVWDAFVHDVRYGLRLLRRNPLFTITAASSLAVCIAANTTVFSIVNRLLLRDADMVFEPDRLVEIARVRSTGGYGEPMMPYRAYAELRDSARSFEGVFGYQLDLSATSMRSAAAAERIFSATVTNNYFAVLGIRPAAGRLFGPDDAEDPGASPVVVLAHRFWTRRFNADPEIIGQTLHIGGQPLTVIGVTPAGFQGLSLGITDVWLPVGASRTAEERNMHLLAVGARLAPAVPWAAAAGEIEAIGRAMRHRAPPIALPGGPGDSRGPDSLQMEPAAPVPAIVRKLLAGFLALLVAMTSIVLLIGCVNVAGALLARATARKHEIAVRLAIGAGRGRLVRQLVTETLLLYALGGLGGLLLARLMTSLLVSTLPALPVPVDTSLPLDARVVAFTAVVALAAAIVSGLVPALQASKVAVVSALKTEAQGSSPRHRLRSVFLIAQIAFSILLVVAAGLLVRALHRSGSVDLGFDSSGVEVATLDLSIAAYDAASGPVFLRELLDRIRAVPGVSSASAASVLPNGGQVRMCCGVEIPGTAPPPGETAFQPAWNTVASSYFRTLGMGIQAGRDFTEDDRPGSEMVTIVSEAAARRFWPGEDPIGKRVIWRRMPPLIGVGPDGAFRPPTTSPVQLTVIGVVPDIQSGGRQPPPFLYLPLQQHYSAQVSILAKSSSGLRLTQELRAAVAASNPNLPVIGHFRLADQASPVLTQLRVSAAVSATVGLVALLLAAIGIYGVTAYAVTRRTREIGIRLAMGAARADVVAMVLRQGLSLVLVGSAIGLLLAAAAGRLLDRLLFGVPPLDPVSFGGAALLFAATGLAACYVPVRRATRISAADALRYE
ncbi:MAG: ADOP family duplicated permease [Burkholderiales bacterium]